MIPNQEQGGPPYLPDMTLQSVGPRGSTRNRTGVTRVAILGLSHSAILPWILYHSS
jgi:hypothetical protein